MVACWTAKNVYLLALGPDRVLQTSDSVLDFAQVCLDLLSQNSESSDLFLDLYDFLRRFLHTVGE